MNRRRFLASSAICALPGARAFAIENESEQALLERLAKDPLRPQFHLLPQAGFLGDPCAPRTFGGENHAFFHGNFGGRGWSHAKSADLLHWQHMPKALTPTENSYDAYGTFTGSVLPGGEGASVIYTGVTKVAREQETIRNEGLKEVQCIAVSMDPDLRSFQKLDRPVIAAPPAGKKIVGFRDPFAWKDGDTWYAGVGSGFEHEGGAVLLYRSQDARNWEYLHPLAQGTWNGQLVSNPVGSGEMWECPDFFPLGKKHVLIHSSEHKVFWEVGTFDKRELRFHSEVSGLLDYGAYYAPKSMLDGRNRRILWGWVQETRSQDDSKAAGWGGVMSLPRVLTLSAQDELQMEVAPEFASLRLNTVRIDGPLSLQAINEALSKAIILQRAGEVECVFKPEEINGGGLELRLQFGSGAASLITIACGGAQGNSTITVGDQVLPVLSNSDGLATIRIWVDGSVLETFVDRRQAITTRSYAAPSESGEIQVVWTGAAKAMKRIMVSNIRPISNDRLTS